uniref:Uncharacterized protein n=1 Tax=Glossina austeni TaxID=7395 RepID=A0A1A9VAD5_GLOAU
MGVDNIELNNYSGKDLWQITSECLPSITMTTNGKKYNALEDKEASSCLIDSTYYRKTLLKKPLELDTLTNSDLLIIEVIADALSEFNLAEDAKINWKLIEPKGRKYSFIIYDLLNCFNTMTTLHNKPISKP